jgi:molecular chaperone DnaK
MTFWLGIDIGTTYTAAALCRPVKGELETRVAALGSRSLALPSVLFLPADGSLVVGEAAERRALTHPDRVVREFKRRIGDEIPLLVGGMQWQAHELAAVLAHWVWQQVNEREGELPDGIALTCPASWGPHKLHLFEQALQAIRIGEMTRLGRVQLLTEPVAAAIGYASRERVEPGAHLAVYDLGGGTFDAAVVRKDSPGGFTLLGQPEGIDGCGGVTFDEMLFEHVCRTAGMPLTEIDPNDPDIVPEVARLRRECAEAKEALSVDTEAIVAVTLGGTRQQVRVTRGEFEDMIRPELDRSIEALHRALESASVGPAQLDAILLVGGSSRIPLVSELVSAEFGMAPAIDTDPKTTVAVGAARSLAPVPAPAEDHAGTVARMAAALPPAQPAFSPGVALSPLPAFSLAPSLVHDGATRPARRRPRKVVLGAAALLVVAAAATTVLSAHGLADDPGPSAVSPVATQSAGSTRGPGQPIRLVGDTPRSSSGPVVDPAASRPAQLFATAPAQHTASPVSSQLPAPVTAQLTLAPTPTPTPTSPVVSESGPTPSPWRSRHGPSPSPAPTDTGVPSSPGSPSAPASVTPTTPDSTGSTSGSTPSSGDGPAASRARAER